MLISLNLTLAEDGKEDYKTTLEIYRKSLHYAELTLDKRKLAHLYRSLAQFYNKNYFLKNDKEYVLDFETGEQIEKTEAQISYYQLACDYMQDYLQQNNSYFNEISIFIKPRNVEEYEACLKRYSQMAKGLGLKQYSSHNQCRAVVSRYSHWNDKLGESGDAHKKNKHESDNSDSEIRLVKRSRH